MARLIPIGTEVFFNTGNSLLTYEQTVDCFKQLAEAEQKLFLHLFSFQPFVNKLLIDLKNRFEESQLEENYSSIKDELESLILWSEDVSKDNWGSFYQSISLFVEKLSTMNSPRELVNLAVKLDSPLAIENNKFPTKFNKATHDKWLSSLKELHKVTISITNKLVLANQGLVGSTSKKYRNAITTSMTLYDLHQEGNFGLYKAIGKFDYKRGLRFSTYAENWIRYTIAKSIGDKSQTIRVPIHVASKRKVIRKFSSKFHLLNDREPTIEEVVKGTQYTKDIVELAKDKINIQYVFDGKMSHSGEEVSGDYWGSFEDTSAKNPSESYDSDQLKEVLLKGMNLLSAREKVILQERFGFGQNHYSDEEKSLPEVGKELDLSRERIRQLQNKALLKMRATVSEYFPDNSQR